jgi:hypothetical protein
VDTILRVGETLRHVPELQHPSTDGVAAPAGDRSSRTDNSDHDTIQANRRQLHGKLSQAAAVKYESNLFMKTFDLPIAHFGYLGMITLVPHSCIADLFGLFVADPARKDRRGDLFPKKGLTGSLTPTPWDRDRNAVALG